MNPNQSFESLSVALRHEPDRTAVVVRSSVQSPSLSMTLTALQNMGLAIEREDPCSAEVDTRTLWLTESSTASLKLLDDPEALCRFVQRLLRGEVEDGRLNGLVLAAGCDANEVLLVRACASYLRQTGLSFSLRYIAEKLRSSPSVVRAWLALFNARFDPSAPTPRAACVDVADAGLLTAMDEIADADTLELSARLRMLVMGIVRTNFFLTSPDGARPEYVAIKIESRRLEFLPSPATSFEIFVFSERFEGIHLRGGRISRGGLRWSYRREDYRSEALRALRAQSVKNAMVVPTGAKGGFVCKRYEAATPSNDMVRECRQVYELFINALLDLTDNKGDDGRLMPLAGVVCHDDPDPYLVVTADVGTKNLSETANAIARARGFWLGDAFAASGSFGSAAQKPCNAAEDVWESDQMRSSQEGLKSDSAMVRAVAIGSVGGEPLGNGGLLTPNMALIAAFDHRHIFVDPRPDVTRASAERLRLFSRSNSTWADYDCSALSLGGGVWARTERSIKLSALARNALGMVGSECTPQQLIAGILKAPVTILLNASDRTYVKAAHENSETVLDRRNNCIQINAGELRARIVINAGNVGVSRAGQVELAERGIQVYTDVMDNFDGVDSSDREVNIRIALGLERLPPGAHDSLLGAVGVDVETMVLANSRQLARRIARHVKHPESLRHVAELMTALADKTGLDRAQESLPDDKQLAARSGKGLFALEIAVVVAHSKVALKAEWLASSPDPLMPWYQEVLRRYFPARLRHLPLTRHPLSAEIVATGLANGVLHRMGLGVVESLAAAHSCTAAVVIDSFAFVMTALALDESALGDSLITKLGGPQRDQFESEIEKVLSECLSTVLHNRELCRVPIWHELRAYCAGSREPDSMDLVLRRLRERATVLSHLQRAKPLIDRGVSIRKALSMLGEIESRTSLGEMFHQLSSEPELRDSPLLSACLRQSFSRVCLRVAAIALPMPEPDAVSAALRMLSWDEPLRRLRLAYKTEWGERRLARILAITDRLDQQVLFAGLAFDEAA
jgi:NAD-specific glutamate dehydrogenase